MTKRIVKISASVALILVMGAPVTVMAMGTTSIILPSTQVQLMVTNYSRQENWTYTCSLLSNAARAVNYYITKAASQLAGVIGIAMPLSETSPPLCAGSGGLGAVSTDLTWDYKTGGVLVVKETTAPRYGNQTCTTLVIWNAESSWPTKWPPSTISESCTKTLLYCSWTASELRPDCYTIASAYGPISDSDYVKEYGIGKSYNIVTVDNLVRRINFSVNTKIGVTVKAKDTNLKKITLTATAYELKNYPPTYTATYRPLGWSEYTVAGQRVGKISPNAYAVSVNGKDGDVIDVTPIATPALPLYTFDLSLKSIADK